MWALLLALLPLLYFSIFAHELGHALLGWCSGALVTSCGVGTARPFWVAKVGAARFYLCLRGWHSGLTNAIFPTPLPSRLRLVSYLGGGMLANAALAAVGGALWLNFHSGRPIWFVLLAINCLLVAQSLLPVTVRLGPIALRSDGAQIWHVLRHGFLTANPQGAMQTVIAFESLWRDTGDSRTLYLYSSIVAMYWADLEAMADAQYYLHLAESLPAPLEHYVRGFGSLCRCLALARMGQLDASAGALDEAAAAYERMHSADGTALVSLARAELQLRQGEADRAAAELEALASQPLFRRHQRWRLELQAARVGVAIRGGDPGQIDQRSSEYSQIRGNSPPTIRDLVLCRELARGYHRLGRTDRAADAYLQAVGAMRSLHPTFTGYNQSRFMASQTLLADEARACLLALERHDEVARIDRFFSGDESGAHLTALTREREGRLRRYAWLLLCANLVAIGYGLTQLSRREELLRVLLAIPALGSLAAALVGVSRRLPKSLVPWTFDGHGRAMFVLTWAGWLVAIVLLVLLVALRASF